MADTVEISRGNTFSVTFAWEAGDTGPADLTGVAVTSSLKDSKCDIWQMDVEVANDGLSFTVSYPGDTSDWSLGMAKWDIKFVFAGDTISHSEIFRVSVIETVTE